MYTHFTVDLVDVPSLQGQHHSSARCVLVFETPQGLCTPQRQCPFCMFSRAHRFWPRAEPGAHFELDGQKAPHGLIVATFAGGVQNEQIRGAIFVSKFVHVRSDTGASTYTTTRRD